MALPYWGQTLLRGCRTGKRMAERKRSKPKKGSKTYRIEFTRLSLFLWGCGVLFGLFWIFVFGILVGRGFLPKILTDVSDIRSQLSIIQEMISREGSDKLDLFGESETDLEMGFYENLSGKKEDEIKAWAQKERVAIPKRKPPVKRTQQQIAGPEKSMGQPRVAVLPRETPNSSLPKIVDTQYTVQLASLGEEAKAHEMVGDLEGSGYPAYVHERDVNGKIYYRVYCGVFSRKGAAENYAEELFEKKGITGLVMKLSANDDD
jgi:cell division septation protein DedD